MGHIAYFCNKSCVNMCIPCQFSVFKSFCFTVIATVSKSNLNTCLCENCNQTIKIFDGYCASLILVRIDTIRKPALHQDECFVS